MMGRLLGKRWICMLLSVLIAFAFWLYVRAVEDPTGTTVFHNVRVETAGTSVLTSQGLTIAGLSTERVEIKVEAPTSVLNNLRRYSANIYVRLDVSRFVEGENKLEWKPTLPTNFNVDDVIIQEQSPAAITVTVGKLYSKAFDVEFQLNGRVAENYQMGAPAIEPESVLVSGPVEQVNQVDRVAAILEDNELDERFAGELPLTLLDQEGNPLTDLEVTLSADTAYVVVPVVVTKEVKLTVNVLPGGGATEDDAQVDIEPGTIVVSGAEADLEGLEEISLGKVSLSEIRDSKSITFPIVLDSSLVNESGLDSAEVKVTVQGLSTAVFAARNITTTPPPNGLTAEVVTQSLAVTIRGRAEDLAGIDASQIRVVADLSNISTLGTQQVPARVYLDSVDTVGVVGDYSIVVKLS